MDWWGGAGPAASAWTVALLVLGYLVVVWAHRAGLTTSGGAPPDPQVGVAHHAWWAVLVACLLVVVTTGGIEPKLGFTLMLLAVWQVGLVVVAVLRGGSATATPPRLVARLRVVGLRDYAPAGMWWLVAVATWCAAGVAVAVMAQPWPRPSDVGVLVTLLPCLVVLAWVVGEVALRFLVALPQPAAAPGDLYEQDASRAAVVRGAYRRQLVLAVGAGLICSVEVGLPEGVVTLVILTAFVAVPVGVAAFGVWSDERFRDRLWRLDRTPYVLDDDAGAVHDSTRGGVR